MGFWWRICCCHYVATRYYEMTRGDRACAKCMVLGICALNTNCPVAATRNRAGQKWTADIFANLIIVNLAVCPFSTAGGLFPCFCTNISNTLTEEFLLINRKPLNFYTICVIKEFPVRNPVLLKYLEVYDKKV